MNISSYIETDGREKELSSVPEGRGQDIQGAG
jgi:hypothetical protein